MKTIELHREALTFPALELGEGPVVLCLHGFPDHPRSFRHQLPALAQAGFRGIAPTMRGYAPGCQPEDGDYHLLSIAEDILAFVDELGQDKVHLIGHDWGAVVSYLVCALAPERFLSLTTLAIASPGRMQNELLLKRPSQLFKSWYMFFFQLGRIADAAVERNDFAFVERLWRDWSPGFSPPAEELAAVKATLAGPGVKKAALGYYRALFRPLTEANRRARALFGSKIRVRTLAMTGARDGCMDTRLHDDLMRKEDFPKGLELIRIEEAGHFLHQEQPEAVNRLILEWLGRSS